MRYYNMDKVKYFCNTVNIETLWSLVGEDVRKKYEDNTLIHWYDFCCLWVLAFMTMGIFHLRYMMQEYRSRAGTLLLICVSIMTGKGMYNTGTVFF